MKVIHDCGIGCWKCHNSGEGMTEGHRCTECKGKGYIGRGEIELDIDPDEYLGPIWCPECGQDLRGDLEMDNETEKTRTEFHYFKDDKGTARVIVCSLSQGSWVAKGIALCAIGDTPNAKFGRRIALGRAHKALEKGTCLRGKMRSERAYIILAKCGAEELFEQPKAMFFPAEALAAT